MSDGGGVETGAPAPAQRPAPAPSAKSVPSPPAGGTPHTPAEDAYALLVGSLHLALGLVLLKTAGLATGGVAGLSLVASYLTGLPVGLFYVVLTVPMLAVTWRAMRLAFVAKTLAVTLALFALTLIAPRVLTIAHVHPAAAALAGGSVIGLGALALALARHGAGAGGTGAMVLWLYRTRGWNAGRTQMAIDAMVLLTALATLDLAHFGYSLMGAAATNGILYVWHRPGRYTGY